MLPTGCRAVLEPRCQRRARLSRPPPRPSRCLPGSFQILGKGNMLPSPTLQQELLQIYKFFVEFSKHKPTRNTKPKLWSSHGWLEGKENLKNKQKAKCPPCKMKSVECWLWMLTKYFTFLIFYLCFYLCGIKNTKVLAKIQNTTALCVLPHSVSAGTDSSFRERLFRNQYLKQNWRNEDIFFSPWASLVKLLKIVNTKERKLILMHWVCITF